MALKKEKGFEPPPITTEVPAMPDDYKTVKITQRAYEQVQRMKHDLLQSGVGNLPPAVKAEFEEGLTLSSVIGAALVCLEQKMR